MIPQLVGLIPKIIKVRFRPDFRNTIKAEYFLKCISNHFKLFANIGSYVHSFVTSSYNVFLAGVTRA